MIRLTRPQLAFIVSGGLLSFASAQPAALEERMRRLEGEVSALRRENQLLRAELGLEGRAGQTIVKPAGREPTFSIGGLLQVQSDFGGKGDARFATANDRFYLRRARINAQGKFLEEFDFKIEGEFAGTLGETSGNRAQLTDAFVNWNRFDFANVRVGQFKTPFGYEQLYADPRLFTVERTLANDRLTVGRQIGVQAGGDPFEKKVSFAAGVFNGTGVNTSANDNDKLLWAGRLSAVVWQGTLRGKDTRWTVGSSTYGSADASLTGQAADFGFDAIPGGTKDNTFTGRRHAAGLDTQFHWGDFDLWAEYLRVTFEPTNLIPAHRFDAAGWYVQAGYFIVPKTLQAVVKYDDFDPNLSLFNNSTNTQTLGANWLLKADDIKLQVDYLISDVDGVVGKNRKLLLRLQTIF
jgi:phosphate-selective porin